MVDGLPVTGSRVFVVHCWHGFGQEVIMKLTQIIQHEAGGDVCHGYPDGRQLPVASLVEPKLG